MNKDNEDNEEEKTTFQVLFGDSNPVSITIAIALMIWLSL